MSVIQERAPNAWVTIPDRPRISSEGVREIGLVLKGPHQAAAAASTADRPAMTSSMT